MVLCAEISIIIALIIVSKNPDEKHPALSISFIKPINIMDCNAPDVAPFDPTSVDLMMVDPRDVMCFLSRSGNDYDERLGVRISAIFVILLASRLATLFPVLAMRTGRIRMSSLAAASCYPAPRPAMRLWRKL
ncbi:hypothetical protein H0G86_010346 [Trichoderma simmonsii]|uniref:Uncharacterized protein n=1 Tax=Trichoderma simmonsii TaxID=1491479 RepID=A0A8G0PNV9_9HYPO|nr:hypothetical protein H0G86_010346 [Trichoderma simmonsii]